MISPLRERLFHFWSWSGFDKQYTGAENIYLYGAVLGYSKDFIREKYDEIVGVF